VPSGTESLAAITTVRVDQISATLAAIPRAASIVVQTTVMKAKEGLMLAVLNQ
jgi:hypothetical protein